MKNSSIIIDINAKDDTIARASMRVSGDKAIVKTAKIKGDSKKPLQVNLLHGFATVLGQLNSAEFVGRVSFIMPESVALRLMGAVKVAKEGGDVADKLYLDWMQNADKNGAGYSEVISSVAEQLSAFMSDEENSLNVVNARQLYRYELVGDGASSIKAGTEIQLINSANEELKVSCTENNFLNGQFVTTTQTIRNRANSTRMRSFVNRLYKVKVYDGEQKSFTASELLTFMNANPKADIEGNSDATSSAISAIKLRAINAEQLPRTVVAKVQKVETATEGALF